MFVFWLIVRVVKEEERDKGENEGSKEVRNLGWIGKKRKIEDE